MPYPKKNLNPNETISLDMHPHWWYLAKAVAALVGAIVLGIVVLVATDSGTTARKALGIACIALLVITAVWLIARYLRWTTTNFVITSYRVIFRQGVFAKSGIEIPLERVNNVNFHQTVFERVLGAGDLLIESGGEDGQQRFTDIRHPDKVQNMIHAGREDRRDRVVSPAATAQPDVAAQLERLEGMMHRGTLTPEEFDAQKRRLLNG